MAYQRKTQPIPVNNNGKTPSLPDSEAAAIGSALRSSESAELIAAELKPEDFYGSTGYKLFGAIQSLVENGLSVNPISVSERAGTARTDVEDLSDRAAGISPVQLKTLISDLQRVSDLRTVYQSCVSASSQITTSSKVEDAVQALESGLYKMDRGGSQEAQEGSSVFDRVKASFLAKVASGGGPEVSTGLKELDRAIISFSGPKVYVIAARPSMGKTALSSTIRRSLLSQGFGVIEFNLEMGADEIAERELAYQARLNLRKVLSGKEVTDEELARVGTLSGDIFSDRWVIDDRTFSIAGMRRRARIVGGRMARKGIKVGAVIIDYLQLAGDNGEGREQSIAAISRGSKLMAKELNCPVMALSQLNRSCEYREDRRPILSDLRESGSLEQDADVAMFIYREHLYSPEHPPEETELIIRKQRSGPIGTVRIAYNAKMVSFHDREIPVNVGATTDALPN